MNMSFAKTTDQVRRQTKTVTRRLGWLKAKPGDVRQPIVKGQGLKKGERVEVIGGPIEFVDVRRERVDAITQDDVRREGFDMTPAEFVAMFCEMNKPCEPHWLVTRIEYRYLVPC